MKRHNAFTLIELLIVVAIIGILASITVVNFLNAMVRARVSRAEAEMRTLTLALEAYHVDNGNYPPTSVEPGTELHHYFAYTYYLTTPISYISTAPFDAFDHERDGELVGTEYYEYWSEPTVGFDIFHPIGRNFGVKYVLWSWGPNHDPDGYGINIEQFYDPSNGTVSNGNIYRFGP